MSTIHGESRRITFSEEPQRQRIPLGGVERGSVVGMSTIDGERARIAFSELRFREREKGDD